MTDELTKQYLMSVRRIPRSLSRHTRTPIQSYPRLPWSLRVETQLPFSLRMPRQRLT